MTIEADPSLVPDWEELKERTKLLPETDGVPLETPWHRAAINLLIEVLLFLWRGRDDFYIGGNMFIYFRLEDSNREEVRGPDFFYVAGADRHRPRESWVVWREDGRYPDVIIELLSRTTAVEDRTTKKALYEQTFHTPEYFLYDPATRQVEGWKLIGASYQAIQPDARGWLWSEVLRLWVGNWDGTYQDLEATWPRFYDAQGNLLLLPVEAAEVKAAEAAAKLAERDAEVARLRGQLANKGTPAP
jgi:Uma2 family endonuclease